jgi:hypothetical protein
MKNLILLIAALLLILPIAEAKPEINEIMYNPIGDDYDFEFLEIHFDELTNISNWRVDGINFIFPVGSEGDGYLVIANTCLDNSTIEENDFVDRYKKPCIHEYKGTLGNEGELISLYDSYGKLMDSVNYSSEWGGLKRGSLEKQATGKWVESESDYGSPGEVNSIGAGDEEESEENGETDSGEGAEEPESSDTDDEEIWDDAGDEDETPSKTSSLNEDDGENMADKSGSSVDENGAERIVVMGESGNEKDFADGNRTGAEFFSSSRIAEKVGLYGLIAVLVLLLSYFIFKKG